MIEAMNNCMAHRGPDAAEIFAEGPVALGHRRLSIIDLSETANQPMLDYTNRYIIVFNGEIYNYQQVKAKLGSYPYKTNSDTEVILAAYERWGVECLRELNGMFAFAIWDRHTQILFMARDRLGKKPFYYIQQSGTFFFASELRALLATQSVPRKLSPVGLTMYLKYQSIPAPDTIVDSVYQLPAAHYALYHAGELSLHPYWSMLNPADSVDVSSREVVEREVRLRLRSAVEKRLISDVPLGAFLSGGIDSSAIVGLMAELSDQPVNTFSIVFQEKKFDESAYSNLIAKRFNTHHTPLEVTSDRLRDMLPEILSSMDTPSGDGPNTYVVSKLTKQAGITVALTGLGGDELFAGYTTFDNYKHLRQLSWFWQLPRPVRLSMAGIISQVVPKRQRAKMTDLLAIPAANPANVLPVLRKSMPDHLIHKLAPLLPVYKDTLVNTLHQSEHQLIRLPMLSQVSVGEILSYAEPLLLRDADQMSMAHSLELRVPFFDYNLVEYVLQVPDEYKTGRSPKPLLTASLHDLLPDSIINRPKMGFSFPWSGWLRGPLYEFCNRRLERLARHELFDGNALLTYWQGFLQNDPSVSWNHIWLLVVLDDWIETNNIQ